MLNVLHPFFRAAPIALSLTSLPISEKGILRVARLQSWHCGCLARMIMYPVLQGDEPFLESLCFVQLGRTVASSTCTSTVLLGGSRVTGWAWYDWLSYNLSWWPFERILRGEWQVSIR